MAREFAELHDELRGVAREMLAKGDPDPTALAHAGWTGLEIPEAFGGAEVSFAEAAVIAEELGRAASRTSLLGTTLGTGTLLAVGPGDTRDGWLSAAAAGEPAAVAVFASGEDDRIPFTLTENRLSGIAEFVPDALAAPVLLILARDDAGVPVIAVAAPSALDVTEQPVLDETRQLASVRAADAAVLQVWNFTGDPEAQARQLADRAAVAIACDSLGIAEAMLATTVEYVGVRHQFGRAIGSFQAVKHACADMAVHIRVARQLVDAAVDAVSEGLGGTAAAMAKAYATDSAVQVTGKAMQLHGGIGYTWESGIHVYLKRAALNRSLFGSPGAHRRRIAARHR